MDKIHFKEQVDLLYKYFRLKALPDQDTLREWYSDVEDIPTESFDGVCHWMKREFDSMPRNVPKAIWAGWFKWRAEHPEKRQFDERTPCSECEGRGLLFARYRDKETKEICSTFFVCAKCDNYRRHIGDNLLANHPRASRDDLRGQGFSVMKKARVANDRKREIRTTPN